MRIVLFGGTGMIGSGTLIEGLGHPDVEAVLSIGRRRTGREDPKLEELVHDDFLDYSAVSDRLRGYDACLFCLGVSSAGMSEERYTRITRDFTLAAAEAFWMANPDGPFCYISGAGADSEEKSRIMWARVRGALENQLLAMDGGPAWIFRPGYIQPVKGVRSRTRLYQAVYAALAHLFPVLDRVAPDHVTTTERLGLALIRVGRDGAPRTHLESADINALAVAERARLDA